MDILKNLDLVEYKVVKKVKEGYKKTELGWIPDEWEFKPLKQICYIKGRIGWQGLKKEEFIDEGPYLITGVNFDRGKIIWSECYHISNERYEQAPEIQLKLGDVLMTKDGTIGKLLYVDDLPDKASLNSHLFVMRSLNENFNTKYFYYHLESQMFKKYIDNNKTGSTMPAITQGAMEKYEILLPLLKEQQKIAEILSTVDSQIDDTDKLIEKTKELKKGLMQRLLTKGIGHKEFKMTEIGEIPVEWKVKQIIQVSDTTSGGTPSRSKKHYYQSGNICWVKTGELGNKYIYDSEEKITDIAVKESSAKLIPINSVIVAMYGATIGKISINKKEVTTNQACCSITCKQEVINYEFLFYNLSFYKEKLIDLGAGGAQSNISQQIIKSFKITVPSLKEQNKIANILSSVDTQIEEYENKKKKLEELKKGLMQKLLTGKIRVL